RKAQMIQLEILKEFDRFCKEHNIKYQLYAGTLLGAIRHKGFIPWDDDIDIAMTRDQYERFLEKYINNERYFLQNFQTDYNYFRQFSRLRKNNTVFRQEQYSNLDIHHGIFIDIFPLDNVEETYDKEKYRLSTNSVLRKINIIRNKNVNLDNITLSKQALFFIIKIILIF